MEENTPFGVPMANSQQGVPESNPSNSQSLTALIVFLFLAIMCVGGVFVYLFFGGKKTSQTYVAQQAPAQRVATTVSGIVAFEGYIPAGAYVSLAERNETEGTQQFKEIVTGLVVKDGDINWQWADATSGQNYIIKALLKVQGKTIQESPIVDVSAPATGVVINLSSQQTPPAPVTASVSGQINFDGYAPVGSTLQVLAKKVGASTYQTIASAITPKDNATWSWANAISGTTYLVKAQLVNANGNVISTSDVDTTTAPTSDELLTVESTATPPAPVATGISGTININGAIPSGAYITLATRPSGTTTFNQVAGNISANNGVAFSWGSANSGQMYDLQAYLWSNSKPYAASNILTVTAPSTFNTLAINAQQPTQAPVSGTINVSCGGTSGGLVQATVNFNTSSNLPNAQSYNIVITSASQNSQVVNTTVNPPNPTGSQSITTTYVFQPSATYYAQYAYATSTGGQMSALSPSIQFACQ